MGGAEHLPELTVAENPTSRYAIQMATLETARQASTQIRFSRKLCSAMLARSRTVPEGQSLVAGDVVFFYRRQMRSGKTRNPKNPSKLMLRRRHGPAILFGHEGSNAVHIAYRGDIRPYRFGRIQPWDA